MSLPNPINVTYVSPLISDTFPFQYIVKDTDNIINIDTTHGEVHVILRNIRNSGMLQYQPLLSINDGGNNAATNNITIYPSAGDIINDSDFYILNDNGANSIIQISNINQWVVSSSQSGGSPSIPFGGTNYIYVYANGTDTENATELQTAYDLAKTMSPSATNRITIICGAGYYNFASTTFDMDTQYIDLVSLDGNRSIIFNSSNALGTLWITANNIYAKGIDVQTKALCVGTGLNNIVVENCIGGNYSFGFGGTISGTFINCIGGNNSFGSSPTTTAPIGVLFNDISAYATGVFTNCEAGQQSFGQSFFGEAYANGTFTNCKSGTQSFGSIVLTGSNVQANGVFKNCEAGDYCFAYNNTCGGTFSNCIAGFDSWVTNNMNGSIYFCRQTSGQTVPTPSLGGGRIVAFITALNNFIAQNP